MPLSPPTISPPTDAAAPADRDVTPTPPAALRRAVLYRLTAAYWLASVVATHVPPWSDEPRGPPDPLGLDKATHLAGYFGLAGLLYLSLAAAGVRRAAVVTVAATLAYGAFDELTQPPFGRSADPIDWLADAAGTVAAVALASAARAWRKASSPSS